MTFLRLFGTARDTQNEKHYSKRDLTKAGCGAATPVAISPSTTDEGLIILTRCHPFSSYRRTLCDVCPPAKRRSSKKSDTSSRQSQQAVCGCQNCATCQRAQAPRETCDALRLHHTHRASRMRFSRMRIQVSARRETVAPGSFFSTPPQWQSLFELRVRRREATGLCLILGRAAAIAPRMNELPLTPGVFRNGLTAAHPASSHRASAFGIGLSRLLRPTSGAKLTQKQAGRFSRSGDTASQLGMRA